MRTVQTSKITQAVKEMCMEVNIKLSDDVKEAILKAKDREESQLGKQILGQLEKNMEIAADQSIPICQDTGMTVVFMKIGQDVHFEGGFIGDAVNEGIRQGYEEGYLRKSVVKDPVERINTNDNTPGIIHYEIVPGDEVEITVAPKGFGSENMSRLYMLKPADGIEGIGGTFEKCALLAKKALTRELNSSSEIPYVKELEEEMLQKINDLGIGPGGLGGKVTALGVNIETYPTHIAGLPVAINICCHVNRHIRRYE